MNARSTLSLLVLGGLGLALAPAASSASAAPTGPAGRSLAHDVYFTLLDASPEAKRKLVEACRLYLSGHEGTVFFATGVRAEEMTREVNDQAFDVSLHVHFRDRAAHDVYQDHPRHARFIAEMRANWKAVRVFDSWVESSR
jgi:hypothetical protein